MFHAMASGGRNSSSLPLWPPNRWRPEIRGWMVKLQFTFPSSSVPVSATFDWIGYSHHLPLWTRLRVDPVLGTGRETFLFHSQEEEDWGGTCVEYSVFPQLITRTTNPLHSCYWVFHSLGSWTLWVKGIPYYWECS